MMKVALFVDHIYSKICYLFLVLGIGFLCTTIYLYVKLPNIIPVHWGSSFKVDSWGRKETLFILPISLFLCLILSSKKFIQGRTLELESQAYHCATATPSDCGRHALVAA